MTGLRTAVGRRVVARDSAETIGDLQGALVDVVSRRIVALQVGKGRKARVVDWSSVSGVGPDAVVVQSASALRDPVGDREERYLKGDLPLLGATVLTDRGDVAGSLDDVEFDETTGQLEALVAGERRFPATGLYAIGSYAVVVADEVGDGLTPSPSSI